MDLASRKCEPCDRGTSTKLEPEQLKGLTVGVPEWAVREGTKLSRRFSFSDFRAAIAFVNHMASLAEAQGHHPDFCVRYAVVDVTVWTHDIGGLSENDFILAAKIDRLPR
jgi:4a-hydroxytetrahydrobiopterin dehydratase